MNKALKDPADVVYLDLDVALIKNILKILLTLSV
jgi:hypothetical protein